MQHRFAPLVLALTLALGGCSTAGAILNPTTPTMGADASRIATKGYDVAVIAGTLANNLYADAVAAGFKGDGARVAYRLLGDYDALLQATKAAITAGDAKSYGDKIAAATDLMKKIIAAIPRKG